MLRRLPLWIALLIGVGNGANAEVLLSGTVCNENAVPLPGAKVTIQPPGEAAGNIQLYTDPSGSFQHLLPAPGEYLVDVERSGYFPLLDQPISLADGDNDADFTLNPVREEFSSVDVTAAPPPIDMGTTETREAVAGTDILNVPYPTTNNLRNALRIVPGVVQDSSGDLHINGGDESQTLFTLDGFNVTDPLTGRFETRLSVEGAQTIDVAGGRLSAEYGKGSTGVLAIHTRTGDDRYRASATNFFPGIEHRKGFIVGNWNPRVNLSGPIRRGRAWFSNATDTVFTNNVIMELPKGEDRTTSWKFSNHLNTQVNITPANILYTGFLINLYTAPRSNLGPLDPYQTTVDRRRRQWFFHVKDQAYLPRGILLEIGYAANRTFGREIPQGHEPYLFTPYGRQGNYFLDATRKSSRDQVLATAILPGFSMLGEHRLKIGTDLNRLSYWQNAKRTLYIDLDADSRPVRRTEFYGNGEARIVNYEASLFFQDSWRFRPNVLLEIGLRGDWDQLLHYWNLSPRFGVAWQPSGLENTKFTAGYDKLYDATPLRIFLRPMDQYSVTTYFDKDGEVARGPAATVFTIPHPRLPRPRYTNYSLGMEQQFPRGFHTRFEFVRKRGRLGFTYLNTLRDGTPPPVQLSERLGTSCFDAVYGLSNTGRDVYDAFQLTVRHVIRRQYEWMFSYTRSRALSNAVIDPSIDELIVADLNEGRLPWDSPNRFLSWGFLPTFWESWSLSYLMEWRTGFPFSVVSEDGFVVGAVNSLRFPNYFEWNLHAERRFEFRNHMWAFRMGVNNLTNHSNPTAVNNNVGSPQFLKFYGGADRSFNFRIRWLGKSGS